LSDTIRKEDEKKRSLSRKLVVLIIIIIVSIPSALTGLLYYQVSSVQLSFELLVEEENQFEDLLPFIIDLARAYLGDISGILQYFLGGIEGKERDISIRLHFTNPTFLYLNIKHLSAQFFIEDEYVFDMTINDLYVPSGKTVYKDVILTDIKNEQEIEHFLQLVSHASSSHGGEVKVCLSGNAKAHLFFFTMGIPFSVEQYYLMGEGFLNFVSARWTDSWGNTISTISKNTKVNIEVLMENPTRTQTIIESIGVRIIRDVPLWFDEEISWDSKSVTVKANFREKIIFSFTPTRSSTYHFDVYINEEKIYTQAEPERLRVTE